MKKALIVVWHIVTIVIALGTVWLALLVIIKPHLLLDVVTYLKWVVDILWWKNYLLLGWVWFIESMPFLNMAVPWQMIMIVIAWFLSHTNMLLTVLIVIFASILWDAVAYGIWFAKWESLLRHYGSTFGLTPERVEKLHGVMKTQAHRAIFASKRNSYTRGILPFLAGSWRMKFWEFMLYNILWSIVYGVIIVVLAKLFIGNYEKAIPYVRWIWIGILIIVWWWYFIKHYRDERKAR
jgi:membrane protein DedA with SNARE-associated domain